jgi:hexosaminidase
MKGVHSKSYFVVPRTSITLSLNFVEERHFKKILFFIFAFINCQFSFSQFNIIPQPVEINYSKAHNVIIDSNFTIEYYSHELDDEAKLLHDYFVKFHHLNPEIFFAERNNPDEEDGFEEISGNERIILEHLNKDIPDTAGFYKMEIMPGTILIRGNEQGIFYGIQTFMQMTFSNLNLQSCMITDYPRFQWRGMHLDVSRHFFGVDFIKKYIDLLAMYKMNVFHWHLTDDQGWRIEIKKYPKLTEIGAWRNGSMIGHYNEQKFDTIRYGGFYTQEEIKEVVAYAKQKHITIVPEIEMPGHAMADLSAYPQYSCTGGPFEVGKAWGVYDDVFCAGNDSTFIFLQNILDEVAELFPGEYIHIGGDECPKTRWKECEKCQSRMKNENLKDEHHLQSYFIQRIEKYLNTKGKKIIGWDEILEGGLAPNAAVMSWRGTEGGIAAAKENHFVVMTPGSHCYFDHYQGNPRFEPLAIGGNTTLEKVYSYEPVPTELNEEASKYILGAQGNVWTEYMYNENQVEYMVLPRMLALSEVLWSEKEQCNLVDFKKRLLNQIGFLRENNFKFSDPFCKLDFTTSQLKEGISLKFSFDPNFTKINYDGWFPKDSMRYAYEYNYEEKIKINRDTIFRIGIENSNKKYSPEFFYEIKLNISKATSKKITFSTPPSKYYNTDADFTLVNGIKGFYPKINSEWLAWQGEDVEMVIDLGKKQKISKVEIGTLIEPVSWIYLTSKADLEFSSNGTKYKSVSTKLNDSDDGGKRTIKIDFKPTKTRFVKIKIKNPGIIQEGNPGAGNPSWMFFDEILID